MWEQIDQLIEQRQSELIALAQRLVATPSVSGDEEQYQLLLAEEMHKLAMLVDLWYVEDADIRQHPAYPMVDARGLSGRPSLVGSWPGLPDGNGRSLMINCHADVVPAGDLVTWSHDPFAGQVESGRLYGRGSCDMKGNTAVALFVLNLLREVGWQPTGEIQLHSVIGEETGGVGTLTSIVRGYRADAAIILEPTDLEIVLAQAGAATFRLTVPGKAAHGSMRNEGVSPIEKFMRLHTALLELEQKRNHEFDHPFYQGFVNKIPLSIGTVSSGVWHSSVPDQLVAEGRYGVRVGETIDRAQAEFARCLEQVSARDQWLKDHPVWLQWIDGQFESTEVSPDEPILQLLAGCCREVLPAPAPLKGVTYGSDMRLLVNYCQIPTVLFGAGDIRVAHGADEFIPIADMLQMAKVVARLIVGWCGQRE
jgi:acetylornithine deacetylase